MKPNKRSEKKQKKTGKGTDNAFGVLPHPKLRRHCPFPVVLPRGPPKIGGGPRNPGGLSKVTLEEGRVGMRRALCFAGSLKLGCERRASPQARAWALDFASSGARATALKASADWGELGRSVRVLLRAVHGGARSCSALRALCPSSAGGGLVAGERARPLAALRVADSGCVRIVRSASGN